MEVESRCGNAVCTPMTSFCAHSIAQISRERKCAKVATERHDTTAGLLQPRLRTCLSRAPRCDCPALPTTRQIATPESAAR
eukprot:151402-Alexandrium_andersonii.AAC.1